MPKVLSTTRQEMQHLPGWWPSQKIKAVSTASRKTQSGAVPTSESSCATSALANIARWVCMCPLWGKYHVCKMQVFENGSVEIEGTHLNGARREQKCIGVLHLTRHDSRWETWPRSCATCEIQAWTRIESRLNHESISKLIDSTALIVAIASS